MALGASATVFDKTPLNRPRIRRKGCKPISAQGLAEGIGEWYNVDKSIVDWRVSKMKCPYCSYPESRVVDSRSTDGGERIRRRRECLKCLKRFTTYEIVETTPLMVIKKDGSRESFDTTKLLRGLMRACEKRPVPMQTLEKMVEDIQNTLYNSLEREVSSQRIGELAMGKLKTVDEVAYVRFASVYRQFKDINSFMDELKGLLEAKG